jgi:ribosomal protein L11 methyltransferase (prmA)
MNDYVEVRLDMRPCPGEDATDLMAGMLGDIGYESFVPDSDGLTAYVQAGQYSADALDEVIGTFPYDCRIERRVATVEGRDWNAEWERHYFQPIVIAGRCVVHSSFHTDIPEAPYDIVIDPKMAFGTGHHATTSQVATALLDMDLTGARLIDMGTGTGILAILAAMHGATDVTGIEIDEFAYNNAVENITLNSHPEIHLVHGDASALQPDAGADVLVANINRNIILGDIAAYAAALRPGGTMVLSGFYTDDIPMLLEAAAPLGLSEHHRTEQDRWACLILHKNA